MVPAGNVVRGVAISPDGECLAFKQWTVPISVVLWDAASRSVRRTITRYTGRPAFSPDGTLLFCDGALVNPSTGEAKVPFREGAPEATDVAFSIDGRLLATAHGGGTARIWSVATGTCLAVLW
ncbi:MAG: WD40 repeat domain-containing protein, partial [bacterium]|nr:WD40 repeat domain-containing protein [bacterium]